MSIRIGLAAMGIVLIVFSFWTHCTKKLMIDYAVEWSLLGACLILMGAIPALSEWANGLGTTAEWGLFAIGVLAMFAWMRESLVNSQLILRSKELAMQVALLNKENEIIKAELERMTGAPGEAYAEEALICY